MERQQKNKADEYSNRVIALMNSAQATDSPDVLDQIRRELLSVLTAAVHDLDTDKVSEESFQSFRAILQIALEVARERRQGDLPCHGPLTRPFRICARRSVLFCRRIHSQFTKPTVYYPRVNIAPQRRPTYGP